jgi:hypothetical protein
MEREVRAAEKICRERLFRSYRLQRLKENGPDHVLTAGKTKGRQLVHLCGLPLPPKVAASFFDVNHPLT